MGLGNNTSVNGTRLTIGIGKDDKGRDKAVIAKRCAPDVPGARPSMMKDGTQAVNKKTGEAIWRLEYDFLEGVIVGLEKRETDFGKFLDIHIDDVGDRYILSLDRGERYWTDFLYRLGGVDLNDRVKLTPYSIPDEDSGRTGKFLVIYQGGAKVERAWTKANDYAGGPPQGEQKEINEEVKWDFGARNRWLEEKVLEPIREKLRFLNTPPNDEAPLPTEAPPEEELDDATAY